MLSTRFTAHSLVTEAHKSIQPYLSKQSIAIDATMGNGHDTLFLARHCQHVYAFDIQADALTATQARLEKNKHHAAVTLIHAGHENMQQSIPAGEKADAIIFNLGYLPHADPHIITQQKSTLSALNQALQLLSPKGILSILAYPGHSGGESELQAVMGWYTQLNPTEFAISIVHSMQAQADSPRLFTLYRGIGAKPKDNIP
ncbi:MAG: methyltransferase domain-containing protein [Methyloprofundus sp.]|nr:methyltransferase domain-containing protein [Methyloprofundus sp.]